MLMNTKMFLSIPKFQSITFEKENSTIIMNDDDSRLN